VITLWLMGLSAWAADGSAKVLEEAIQIEVDRAMTGLALPNQPRPHHISVIVGDAQTAEVWASDGALTLTDDSRPRFMRVDVRVGTPELDSGNFQAAFGRRQGMVLRGLGREDEELALRREVWIALDRAYKGATETLAAKLAARRGRDLSYTTDFAPAEPARSDKPPARQTDFTELQSTVLALSKAVTNSDFIEVNEVGGAAGHYRSLFYDTAGTRLWRDNSKLVIRASVQAKAEDGSTLVNNRSWIAQDLSGLPPIETMTQELREAASWLNQARKNQPDREYLGPVLFAPAASAELFRQLLQPQICGTPPMESAPENASQDARPIPTARIGRRLLPSGWRVTDDAQGHPELVGAMSHDYEGVPTRAVSLVEDGVLRDVLMSRTPRSDRDQSTGHARGMATDRFEAMPTQVNIAPGKARSWKRLRRQALSMAKSAGLSHVMIVKRLAPPSMEENLEFSITGDEPMAGLTTPTEVVKLYADGREEPVRGLRFVGADRRTLRDIVAAGRTQAPVQMLDVPGGSDRFGWGWFEGLGVSWAVPPVLIDEMELHARSGGEARVVTRPE
jgi:hypothetical protein